MEKQFEKVAVSVAANPIHRFSKKYTHTTTSSFMEFNLATVMEIPKSALKAKHKTFIRSFPLKRPLMSNIKVLKQAFFVPYRCIWEPWSDFRTDTPHNQPAGTGIISNTPLIDLVDLIDLFKTGPYSSITETVPSDLEHGCDFVAMGTGSREVYGTLTTYGRWALKLFNSAGLRIPFADVTVKGSTVDALPFLAIAKVYLDYFFPNQYAHYGVYATIDGIMQRQVTYTLTGEEIDTILHAIYKVSYDSDYFVSAFDNPLLGANGTQSLDFNIQDISLNGSSLTTSQKSHIVQSSNGTPIEHQSTDNTAYTINHTQYMDSMLKSLTNYIRRHSLVGSRALTRYLADWGVVLTADKLKRCYKLGEAEFPVQVGDVMSTSDTYNEDTGTGAQLGDYAGRSVAYNDNMSFDCDTDEDGLLVVTYSIVPTVSYVQGIQRYWFHKTKLDFLTGDFDGVSIREIRQIELFCGMKRIMSNNEIFGYIPSYAEMKIDYDVQSGDFMVDTKNLGLMGFESARLFSDSIGDSNFNVAHSLDFVLGGDSEQFNRIFFDGEPNADKFIVIHRCEFEHNMPAVPLWDNYDFEDNKKKIKMSVNGAKDN